MPAYARVLERGGCSGALTAVLMPNTLTWDAEFGASWRNLSESYVDRDVCARCEVCLWLVLTGLDRFRFRWWRLG